MGCGGITFTVLNEIKGNTPHAQVHVHLTTGIAIFLQKLGALWFFCRVNSADYTMKPAHDAGHCTC
jgi:hypothetical protein